MKVIVDTAMWSLAFRRQIVDTKYREVLKDLIADGRVVLLGAVRQEVLSGMRHQEQFERLKRSLRAFPNLALDTQDYELAAEYRNLCQRRGIQSSNTDFLICAAAVNYDCEVLTTDKDFVHFSQMLPIRLYQPF